jgi:hypothetical protein
MARRRAQAVGPWSDYVGILSWRKGENIERPAVPTASPEGAKRKDA